MKQPKRILSIELKRMDDTDPDTSYLGTYSKTQDSLFSIDHGLRTGESSLPWFTPASVEKFNPDASWIPARLDYSLKHQYWYDAMVKNAESDYARMESFNRGDWGFIGIRAQADVVVDGVCQSITSAGLWGIESDSEESYLCSVEKDELSELRGILHILGFSKRAIAAAVCDMKAGL